MGRIGRLFDNNDILQTSDHGLFTPSYELAKSLIEQKDKDLDDFEDARGKLQEKLAIAHMDTENDTREARELLQAYQDELDSISVMAMNDRLNTGLYRRNLTDLQGRMMRDAQTGRWYDLARRAGDEAAWKEQNAQIMKGDPTLYNRLYDRYKQQHEELGRKYHEEGVSSWRVPWQAIVPKPNLTDDESLKTYSLIKENMWDKQRGMYIYNNKEVSEQEAARIALNRLLSDNNVFGYAAQMASLGEKGYLDANGNLIPPMIEDLKGTPQINPLSAFAPMLQEVIDMIAFRQQTVRPDPVALAAADRAAAQMARRGSGKPEKEKEPSLSYITRVANEPTSMEQINDAANRVRSGQFVTEKDRDDMERAMHVHRNLPLEMRTASGEEVTLGQLGVNDGLDASKFPEHRSESREGREQFSYMDKSTVDTMFDTKAETMRSLSKAQLRTLLLARGGATTGSSGMSYKDIRGTSFGVFDDMRNAASGHKDNLAFINDDNDANAGTFGVKVMSNDSFAKSLRGQSYTMQDIHELKKADNVDVEDIIRFARFIKDFTDTDFVNDPITQSSGWLPTNREHWIAYFQYKAPEFGITPWMVKNDPRIYALLPAGQTYNYASHAYSNKRYERVSKTISLRDGDQIKEETVQVASGPARGDYIKQLYYEGVNSSSDKFYGSVASRYAIGLGNVIKDYNDGVANTPSIMLDKDGRSDMFDQFSLLLPHGENLNSMADVYKSGSNTTLNTDEASKLYNAMQNEHTKFAMSAGSSKGPIMISVVTNEVDGNVGTYQIVPRHAFAQDAFMAVGVRQTNRNDYVHNPFKRDALNKLIQQSSNRYRDKRDGSVIFTMPANGHGPRYRVLYSNNQFFLGYCTKENEFPCDFNGNLLQLGNGKSEKQAILEKYTSTNEDGSLAVKGFTEYELLNQMYNFPINPALY